MKVNQCQYLLIHLVAKEQVLAHLANFAYDPINYEWLRKLHVIDLFLDMLTESNVKFKEFGISGLANLCDGILSFLNSCTNLIIDQQNARIIIENKGISLIIKCLSSPNEETVLSTIYTLSSLLYNYPKNIHGN